MSVENCMVNLHLSVRARRDKQRQADHTIKSQTKKANPWSWVTTHSLRLSGTHLVTFIFFHTTISHTNHIIRWDAPAAAQGTENQNNFTSGTFGGNFQTCVLRFRKISTVTRSCQDLHGIILEPALRPAWLGGDVRGGQSPTVRWSATASIEQQTL